MNISEKYMKIAINQAKKAGNKNEIPVGVIIVKNNVIISRAHNSKEKSNDPTKHAEIIAIQKASKKLGDWRLKGCSLYVTLEPCLMCTGAIIEARIKNVICGTENQRSHHIIDYINKNKTVNIEVGVLEKECKDLIKNFFIEKRKM